MIVRHALTAMGTRFELVLHGEDEFLLRAVAEEAAGLIGEEHQRLNAFDPTSVIGRVNALAAERPVGIDREIVELLELCARVWEDSGGAFDPAVGAVMERLGHRGGRDAHSTDEPTGGRDAHPTGESAGGRDALPTGESAGGLDGCPPGSGFGGVILDREACTVAFGTPSVLLDLGGVAKGDALDKAARAVREAGVEAALLHGGTSSIVAIGSPPGERGWRVRLGQLPPGAAPVDLVLRDVAVSVSAPSGRVSGSGAGHIVDPRTGEAAELAHTAVVCGASGAMADAWATALVVLGIRPDTMPNEIGSAVLTDTGWAVSPSMATVFQRAEAPPGGAAEQTECDR